MSLAKSIQSGKDRRKPFRKAARYVRSCRCHGGCDYCLSNRQHAVNKAKAKADYREEEEDA